MWHRRRACTRARCLAVLHPTTRELVDAETAARIDEIIADLNYRPNVIARGPRMQQTRLVAVIDMPFVDQFRPPLTTVRIPHRGLGATGRRLAACGARYRQLRR